MYIACVNQSTLVQAADVAAMTAAIAKQVRYHAAPAWDKTVAAVVFHADETHVPPGAHIIGVFDDSDQQGALGWHTEDAGEAIYGRVFARPVLDNGGDALHKDLSVASVLSHEVLEMWADPSCVAWIDDHAGHMHALEICDPVEADSYLINKITVSNFVTPAWFDPDAKPGDTFDYLKKTSAPFQLAHGGYEVWRTASGQERQRFGDNYQEWRHSTKETPLARTGKRMATHAKANR